MDTLGTEWSDLLLSVTDGRLGALGSSRADTLSGRFLFSFARIDDSRSANGGISSRTVAWHHHHHIIITLHHIIITLHTELKALWSSAPCSSSIDIISLVLSLLSAVSVGQAHLCYFLFQQSYKMTIVVIIFFLFITGSEDNGNLKKKILFLFIHHHHSKRQHIIHTRTVQIISYNDTNVCIIALHILQRHIYTITMNLTLSSSSSSSSSSSFILFTQKQCSMSIKWTVQ